MSNFKFIQEEWLSLYTKLKTAEERVFTEPVSTATYCRLAVEECMYLLFDIEHIEKPYNTELVQLMDQNGKAMPLVRQVVLEKGENEIRLDLTSYPAGAYMISLQAPYQRSSVIHRLYKY